MPTTVGRKHTIAAPLVALLLIGAFATLPAGAAPVKKIYTAEINPVTASAGATQSYTLKLINSATSSQSFGSADIAVPAGFVVTTPIANPVTSTAKSWTATLNAGKIQLRSPSGSMASVPPGGNVAVTFQASAPCAAAAYTFTTQVKQSNDFQGPLNDFTLKSGTSQPKVTVSGSCTGPAANIAFVTGPSDTAAGGTMANVTVKVTDASNNPVSGQSVTLSSGGLATSPSAAQTTAAGTGIATFSGLTVGTLVGNYAMTASSGSLTTAPSTFNITPGAPDTVVFVEGTEPTNTKVGTSINGGSGGSGVQVRVRDINGNLIPSSPVAMTIGVDPTGSAVLTGTSSGCTQSGAVCVTTNGAGVASFGDLQINLTSSGYRLNATAGTKSTLSDPATFAITNTQPDGCTAAGDDCTVQIDDNSTVTVPPGVTVIVESNQLDCGPIASDFIAGTVTVDPNGATEGVPITFDDQLTFPIAGPVPFCKFPNTDEAVPLCSSIPNGLNQPGPTAGKRSCLQQSFVVVSAVDYTAHSIVWIDEVDPPIKH